MWEDNGYHYIKPESIVSLNDKKKINPSYRDIVYRLKKMYPEVLSHINAEQIKFVVEEWEPTDKSTKNSKWKVTTKKETGPNNFYNGYKYVINLRTYWLDGWNDAQVHACILGQLLRIDPEFLEVISYEEGVHSKLALVVGDDYLEKDKAFDKDPLEKKLDLNDFEVVKTPDAQVNIDDLANEPDEETDELPVEPDESEFTDEVVSNVVDVEFVAAE